MIKKILLSLILLAISISDDYSYQKSFNNFGISLFKVINSDSDNSFVISPISISYALMMVNYGASGNTSDNILNVLNINNHIDSIFFNPYANVNSKFKINNSIWIQDDKCYEPNSHYINTIDSTFNAEVSYVNFYKDRTSILKDINEWVNKKTFGTIKKIVSKNDIKKNTTQALISSIYFKDNWQFPFDSSKTKSKPFFKKEDSTMVDMLHKKNKYAYYQSKNHQILELPYQSDGVSMYIILPSKNIELDDFINIFDYDLLLKSFENISYNLVSVSIPKFETNFSTSIKEYLISLGMNIPFNPLKANFDKFWDYQNQCKKYPPKNYIDVINHKSYIKVDENGTEASAATAIIISRVTSIRPFDPLIFNANRPFIYLIYDKINNNIMFLGKFTGK